ncbi:MULTISPECIES: hypothetical protein [Streptomyces]|uniref:hypothetical protein n=1 Tax=Streptomyces TaxID=1883 RepID=UPI001678748E|nr:MULTISPECIES: hypothetical protein [Streptomyces]MBD3578030.1 hypothetical protein [Streptomyces sp. KD18]GGT02485.1 hypothetical protein GCM10010286_29530 [Streptomyces toxytricini]
MTDPQGKARKDELNRQRKREQERERAQGHRPDPGRDAQTAPQDAQGSRKEQQGG